MPAHGPADRSPGAAALGTNRGGARGIAGQPGRRVGRPGRPDLSDVAFTLAGRRKHDVTMAAVVHDREHAATVLRAAEHDNVFVGESVGRQRVESTTDRVVFMFPGQGAQHVGMARGLYDTEPVFAEHFDACVAGFRSEMGIDLHAEIFGDAATDLERIDRSQPALFTVEYALARLIETYGVRAGAYIGYSTGEYIAATLAGVFDLETAIKLVSLRARLMHESPPGAMVAVALGPDDIAEYLTPASSCPRSTTRATASSPGRTTRSARSPNGSREARDHRAAGPRDPRIPFQLNGCHGGGVREFLSASARPAAHAAAQQPHRNLDVGRTGHRSGQLGTPNQLHDQVRRRTRCGAEPIRTGSSWRWAPAAA